jgi:hypothetical protein
MWSTFSHQGNIPLDPAPRAVHNLATNRAKRRQLAAPAHLVNHIHITRNAAPATPHCALGARGGKAGHFLAARGALFVNQVDIPLDPAPRAVHGLATARAKRRLLAAPAQLALHIHIPRHAAPAAPECALGARGGKDGLLRAASGAHLVFQIDLPLDPAPSTVRFLSTCRAKRWLFAAPALFGHHIHIPRNAARAAPECALGARGGKGGTRFAAR